MAFYSLTQNMENCFEDLFECFEDFVKKSLVMMSIGIGAIVVMALYFLNSLIPKNNDLLNVGCRRCQQVDKTRSSQSCSSQETNVKMIEENTFTTASAITTPINHPNLTSTSANTDSTRESYDVCLKVEDLMGFTKCDSCKSLCEQNKTSQARVQIPCADINELIRKRPAENSRMSPIAFQDFSNIQATMIQCFWAAYSAINGNYFAIATTVFLVVLFSVIMTDLSKKLYVAKELNDMKKVVLYVLNDSSRTEVACLTQNCGICTTQNCTTETENQNICSVIAPRNTMHASQSAPENNNKSSLSKYILPCKNTSNKEVTIMSFFYTDFVEGVNEENLPQVE